MVLLVFVRKSEKSKKTKKTKKKKKRKSIKSHMIVNRPCDREHLLHSSELVLLFLIYGY